MKFNFYFAGKTFPTWWLTLQLSSSKVLLCQLELISALTSSRHLTLLDAWSCPWESTFGWRSLHSGTSPNSSNLAKRSRNTLLSTSHTFVPAIESLKSSSSSWKLQALPWPSCLDALLTPNKPQPTAKPQNELVLHDRSPRSWLEIRVKWFKLKGQSLFSCQYSN